MSARWDIDPRALTWDHVGMRSSAADRPSDVEHRPARPEASPTSLRRTASTTPQNRILLLQKSAGNAAVAGALTGVQREITVESDQTLPRAAVERDPTNARRLVVRYGDAVVAGIEVAGGGVDAIQIRDRTGARNQGGPIAAIDLDVLHPPGVVVTLKPSTEGLAKTRKALGVGDIKVNDVERKPPYGKDELQLWPPAHALGPQQQRREQTPAEKKADEERRAADQAQEQDTSRRLAELRKEYQRLTAATDIADRYLMDLYGIGLVLQMMTKLPAPTHYNDIRKDLFEAAKALDNRAPGRAKVLLKRADAALWKANGEVSAAVKRGIENIDTAMAVTSKVAAVSTLIGETVARMIPGPIGKVLTLLYEVLKPAPKTMDEAADRLRGATMTGQGWGQNGPLTKPKTGSPKGSGTATVPDDTPTVRDPSKRGTTTVPQEEAPAGGSSGGGSSSRTSTARSDQKTAKGGPTPEGQTARRGQKVGGKDDQFLVNKAAQVADRPSPSLEDFSGYQMFKQFGGQGAGGGGINIKYLLRAPDGKFWMFKPARLEERMGYGPAIGIQAGERYRRAAAAAYMADKLGVDTPAVRLGTWNGQKGSLQEWRPGYATAAEVQTTNAQKFQQFWNSQQRKDLDALDYVTAQQDRHTGNVMLKDKPGGGTQVLAIDQDAAFPTSSARFDPKNISTHPRANYQRPLSSTMSNDMARRMRDLDKNWPEADLRQWLTKAEVDGARARLTEIITKLDAGQITVVTR